MSQGIAYRICADTRQGDHFLIITGSRERAMAFCQVLSKSTQQYKRVFVEVGTNTYCEDNIQDLP
jgi:hypothetical protein